jgi:hypothetical protein
MDLSLRVPLLHQQRTDDTLIGGEAAVLKC